VKPEHVVAIALRLFAIYLSVATISGVIATGWFVIASASSTSATVLLVFATVLLSLGIACLLWRFAVWIAVRMVRLDGSVNTEFTTMAAEEIQTVAFTILGLYFLFRAVTGAVYWLVFFGRVGTPLAIDPQQWASIAETIAEFVLACFLVFGAAGLGVLITKVRRLGQTDSL
jgi:hypothetical protein